MTNETQIKEAGAGNAANSVSRANSANGAVDAAAVRSPRVNFAKAAPKPFKALIGLDAAAREGLDPALVELVQIRSSQLNKCAYCLHMHTSDAHKAGESAERLHMVAVWEEAAHFFTAKERAALALTEAVTLVAQGGVADEVYERAAAHFDEAELAGLLALIFTINTWNRIAISTGKVAGADER